MCKPGKTEIADVTFGHLLSASHQQAKKIEQNSDLNNLQSLVLGKPSFPYESFGDQNQTNSPKFLKAPNLPCSCKEKALLLQHFGFSTLLSSPKTPLGGRVVRARSNSSDTACHCCNLPSCLGKIRKDATAVVSVNKREHASSCRSSRESKRRTFRILSTRKHYRLLL